MVRVIVLLRVWLVYCLVSPVRVKVCGLLDDVVAYLKEVFMDDVSDDVKVHRQGDGSFVVVVE